MKNALFAVVFLCVTAAHAQQQTGFHIADHLLIREFKFTVEGARAEVYEGSPYYHEDLQPGYVETASIKFNPVPMRFNISEGLMEYKVGENTFVLDPDPKITRIQIGKETFIVLNKSFYELKLKGKMSLVAKPTMSFRERNDLTGIPAKYARQSDTYYLNIQDLPLEKVTSLKKFLEFVPDKKGELAAFAKAERLSTKDLPDLLKLVAHYNTLSAGQ